MTNHPLSTITPGNLIYVYNHSTERIIEAVVADVNGGYYNKIEGKYETLYIRFFPKLTNPHQSLPPTDEHKSFFVDLREENNKRGTRYTGFSTYKEAQDFYNWKIENKIKEKEEEIIRLKGKIKELKK
jgi:hypothetical protein